MRLKRKLTIGVGLTALALVTGACASSNGAGTTSARKDLVMFTITGSNVYGANQIKGAQEEAKELGYNLKVFQNSFSQPEQDQQVQQYLASGAKPAAVIFWPWIADAAVNDVRQLSQVAPVIQITQEPNAQSWPYVKAYSGANQVLIGQTAGQMMLEARKAARSEGVKLHSAEGNLLVFQHPEGEKTGVERWKGFTQATQSDQFNVLGTVYGANDPDTGYKIGSEVIPKYISKGIDFLYVSNQQAANGIIRALKENRLQPGRDLKIVSSDCSGSLDAVKNGETFGTGLQPAAIEGRLAVITAAKYIATGKTVGDVKQLDVTRNQPKVDLNSPPAKFNYMPHAPATGKQGVADANIWGYTADQICASN
ncbi:sugar ABC transporter substrate-binding protein [Streptomyces sp. CA-106131]|uniref:sugar ABC transporter substrate-binding protein n=1 Tax=Streptomyces sp. CA-106131 TaxID=3240045 RepID=UPI003D94543F